MAAGPDLRAPEAEVPGRWPPRRRSRSTGGRRAAVDVVAGVVRAKAEVVRRRRRDRSSKRMHTQSRADGCGSVIALGTSSGAVWQPRFRGGRRHRRPLFRTRSVRPVARRARTSHRPTARSSRSDPPRPMRAKRSRLANKTGVSGAQPFDDSPRVTRGRAVSPDLPSHHACLGPRRPSAALMAVPTRAECAATLVLRGPTSRGSRADSDAALSGPSSSQPGDAGCAGRCDAAVEEFAGPL